MTTRIDRAGLAIGCLLAALALIAGPSLAQAGGFSYDLVQVSPSTQMQPVIDFSAPYFNFDLTNTGQNDDYFLEVRNTIVTPTPPSGFEWFEQVCIGTVCFIETTTVVVDAGMTKTVGVNVVPFIDGVGTFDFYAESVNNPSDNHLYSLRLFAGTHSVDVEIVSDQGAERFTLRQNAPNPVRESTRISFMLPQSDRVSLSIFDVTGRLVRALRDGHTPAGSHSVTWDGLDAAGSRLSGGVYYYRLTTTDGAESRRMTVLR